MTRFHIPDDVRETVRAHRTMAEIIRELGEQHQRHVEDVRAFEERLNTWAIPSAQAVGLRPEPFGLGPDGLPSLSQERAA